ncbi:MAG: beta-CASP ribonuclease aCPSF1 [Candidatus Altiarchaeota archaeon]|nr:beta-CASP ribonuclease aCPSF1 [Candidatus Altiarchaeota archaeon]
MGGLEILREVKASLPKKADLKDSRFEGAGVVVFSNDLSFVLKAPEYLREVAKKMKLRVEARADRSLLLPPGDAKEKIEKIIKSANMTDIFFDAYGSKVIIEVEKPSEVLGNGLEKIMEIKAKTAWTPLIQRKPPLKSDIITTIRKVMTKNSKERAEFLNQVGMKIYSEGKEPKWVRVSFLGAAREIGRSAIFVQTPESRILMDCGINVAGTGEDSFPLLEAPEFRIDALDATIISHAHLDHSGFVPFLYKYGYKGPVYCSKPTLHLSTLLQLDAIEVAQREGQKVPYSTKDIENTILHSITLPEEEVANITPDVRLTLYNAAHILGSNVIHLHIGEGFYNLVYTGDFKYGPSRLHEPATNQFPRVEGLIMESTYGGKDNVEISRKDAEDNLLTSVKEILKKKGKLLMPVLGAGRAQEVMLILEAAMTENRLPKVPIYIDGIVWDSTAIYTTYPEFLHKDIRRAVFSTEKNPLLNPIFGRVGGQKEREDIVKADESCIIMATSGMMTGGPSVFYFAQIATNPNNGILFVNYQGEGTLGRRVQRQPREITMATRGNPRTVIPLNAKVFTAGGLSAHSDRKQLVAYVGNMSPKPNNVIVVHGEPGKAADLAAKIRNTFRIRSSAPNLLDSMRLK